MVRQALRFGLVGLVNTAVGYAVILAALAAGFGDYASNALGYATGLVISFILNRNWAFGAIDGTSPSSRQRHIILYAVAFALSYGANLVVLTLLRTGHVIAPPIAQLAATATYTTCFFVLCRQFVFAGPNFRMKSVIFSSGFALVAIAAVGAPIAMSIPVSHDVIWQMWIARQMSHGTRLYADIVELNPPLWFWMGLAAQKASTILNCSSIAILKLGVWFWAAFSAYAVGFLWPELTTPRRTALVLFTFAVCTLMPLHNYGQREHLVLIAGLPYAFLLAARARAVRPDAWLVVLISLAAALGFALKHYFVLMPLLGEAWLLFRLRRKYKPLRPETIILVASAIVYGAAVWLWARAFLTAIVPMVEVAYKGYEVPLLEQLNKPEQVVWLLATFCFARFGQSRDPAARSISEILMIATATFIVAYFAQKKGWPYHAIPATGTAIMAVFVSMILPARTYRDTGQLLSGFTCALPLLLGVIQGPYSNNNEEAFDSLVAGMSPGSNFLAITTRPSWAWPMIETTRHAWPSRYFAFWMIDAIGVDEASDHPDPSLQRLGQAVVRNTVEDMRCNPPERVFTEVIPTNPGLRAVNFRMLEFFDRDPEFVEIMRHYRPISRSSIYALYGLARPYGALPGDHCRVIYR